MIGVYKGGKKVGSFKPKPAIKVKRAKRLPNPRRVATKSSRKG